jgi:hypothetical protein
MSVPTEKDIARAQALGRMAARTNRPVTEIPYPVKQRALRRRWVQAYLDAGGGDLNEQ